MISVCIPVYEQFGFGASYLTELLESLSEQKGKFEVVVSDNSKSDAIKRACAKFPYLGIRYFLNHETFGVANNTNNAISKARCKFIKPMYSDDVLIHSDALRMFEAALMEAAWVVSYSRHMNKNSMLDGVMRPRWTDGVIRGDNSIGMPSVVAFRKNTYKFDSNLTTLLDCYYYWLLYQAFGAPHIIAEPLVGQRYWNGSMSANEPNHKFMDYQYLKSKHANLV